MTELRDKIGDFFISLGTLERVPSFLRFITWVSLGCAIFFPLFTILPLAGGKITVDGDSLTWLDFWKRGDALIFLIGDPILLAVPYGVLQRKWWVRPYLIGLPAIQILTAGIIMLMLDHPSTQQFHSPIQAFVAVLLSGAWAVFFVWYLYYKKTVVDFFTDKELHPGA